ncbi:MAG: hypothetical protein ACRCYU_18945, partial [Nocardioides sp.]
MTHRSRQSITRQTLAVGVLAPLTLVGLVACGGDDTKATAAGDNPAEVTSISEKIAEGDSVDAQEFVNTLVSAIEETSTAHVTLALKGAGQNLTADGDIDYAKTPAELKLTMSIPQLGDGVELLLVDGAIYVKSPGLSDGKYIKTDLDDPRNPLGSTLTGQIDPREQ